MEKVEIVKLGIGSSNFVHALSVVEYGVYLHLCRLSENGYHLFKSKFPNGVETKMQIQVQVSRGGRGQEEKRA